jgi:hypothetical protein
MRCAAIFAVASARKSALNAVCEIATLTLRVTQKRN